MKIEPVGDGFRITRIALDTEAEVPGIDPDKFREQAEAAKRGCPVSQALAGTEIALTTHLVNRHRAAPQPADSRPS